MSHLLDLANLITKTTENVLKNQANPSISSDLQEIRNLIGICEQQLTELELQGDQHEYEQELLLLNKKYGRLEELVRRKLIPTTANVSQPNLTAIENHVNEGTDNSLNSLNNHEILDIHEKLINDQDQHLEKLSKVIGRQKEIGQLITNELDSQVELLQDIDNRTEDVGGNMSRINNRLNNFTARSNSNKNWGVIWCLLAILVVVIVLVNVL